MLQKTQMVRTIEKSKKIFKSTLVGSCKVTVRSTRKNPKTKVNEVVENILYDDLACRLSFAPSNSSDDGDTSSLKSSIVLLVESDVNIPPNSKIEVKYLNRDYILTNGKSKVYNTHTEYNCEEFVKWL